VATSVAVQAEKAASGDAAVEIPAELALDEPGHRSPLLACIGEEGLEVLSYDLVEQCLLGLVAFVVDGWGSSRDRAQRQESKSRAVPGADVGRASGAGGVTRAPLCRRSLKLRRPTQSQ